MTYVEPTPPGTPQPEIQPDPTPQPEIDPSDTPDEMPPMEPGGGDEGDPAPTEPIEVKPQRRSEAGQ